MKCFELVLFKDYHSSLSSSRTSRRIALNLCNKLPCLKKRLFNIIIDHDFWQFDWEAKAQFRRRTFHEPNLISWIKYMKSSASESVKNGYLNLERLSRSFRLALPGISPLERLWFRSRTFHVPNLMHIIIITYFYTWPENRLHFDLFWFKLN